MAKTYIVIGSLGDRGKQRLDVLLPSLRSNSSDFNVLVNWQVNQDQTPRGFAHAYNRLLTGAFSDSECQYAWILGDDVFPDPDCLHSTQTIMEQDVSIGAVFPIEFWNGGITMIPFVNELVPIGRALESGPEQIEQIYAGMACACISRAAWSAVGPLDESIGKGYAEDLDWGIRCWKAGFRVVNYRRAAFHHLRGATYGRLHEQGILTQAECAANAERCKQKWKGLGLWDDPAEVVLERLRADRIRKLEAL